MSGGFNSTSRYAGLTLRNGYSGTVTFPIDLTFDDYDQACGKTAEASSGLTVTVTNSFAWTGGTVNDTTCGGTVVLSGVAGASIGTTTTGLSSGSSFLLEDRTSSVTLAPVGTDLTLHGTFVSTKSGDDDITSDGDNCDVDLGYTVANSTDVRMLKGKAKIDGGTIKSLEVNGPTTIFNVLGGGCTVTGNVAGTLFGVELADGMMTIQNSATLKTSQDMMVSGGTLMTVVDPATTAQKATIDGIFRMSGGDVALGNGGAAPSKYSTHFVTGNAFLYGGKFEPKMDATNGANRDVIETEDSMDCGTSFHMMPREQNGSAALGTIWKVLVTTNGFASATEPTNDDIAYTMRRTPITDLHEEIKK